MAGALISIICDQLTSIASKQIEERVQLVVGVEDEVQKLKRKFRAIQAVLEDAEKRQFNEAAVRLWLDELKDACYDIDDVLDEWSTAILKHQIQRADDNSPPNKKPRFSISSVFSSVLRPIKQGILRNDIATKIKELNERLDVIAKERETYGFELKSSEKEPERQISTSLIDVSEVKGRASDKNVIIDQLLHENSPEEKNFHVISIVGLGGIGKTTLAQLAYNDDVVNTHFKKKIWVCVSDPFDEVKIAKAILQQLQEHQGSSTATNELNALHEQIRDLVREKKFLLVLDDVWTKDNSKWGRLKNSLMSCTKGSKVLVTTRNEEVARMMFTTHTHDLKKLSELDCWSLFKHIAFFERSMEECENLEEIGKKIVKKCDGLPLAAKTLGSLMRLKDSKEEWQAVLDSEVWKLEFVEQNLHASLLLSYYDLPPKMKRLFSYCAVFPKDTEIKRDYLVQLWMAQGYLDSEENSKMEIQGREYFKNLAMRSFFQDFEMDEDDGSIIRCKMHDIVHDLAQVLTQNECIVMENDNANVLGKGSSSIRARHASITSHLSSSSFPNLRTILLLSEQEDDPGVIDLCNRMSCLRALDMRDCSLREIPREVGKLIHLRYLNLSGNRDLNELPEEVCELCNLQTLNITWCSLKRLPHGIGKLIYLRYLNLSYNDNLEELPEEVCELCNLQTLKLVMCSLKRLPQGIGKLIYLRYLNLSKNDNLEELPEEVCELCNLQTLKLTSCSLKRLPQGIGKLIYLRYLNLSQNDNLEELPEDVCELCNLQILNLPLRSLKRLPQRIGKLIYLRCLNLSYNKYLKELPEEVCELCNLQTLHLAICSLERLPQGIGKLIYLRYLNLSFNKYLKELPEEVCELCNLQTLSLNWCSSIERLPQGIGKLISLRHLELEETNRLEVLPKGIGRLSSLRTLSKFIVSDDCKIGELRSLNHLQGDLEIVWLGKVTDVNEVERAELKNKKELRGLTICFNHEVMDYERLEVLQPPSQLESLSIERYGATTLSTNCITFSSNLKFLHLQAFQNCECLLHLGRLSSLEKLTIIHMHSVKRVGVEFLVFEKQERPFISFPKLKELVFKKMWEWEEWEWITITSADKKDEIPIIMPYLRSLELYNCPKLKALPDHFLQNRSFDKVKINECPFVEEQLREMGVKYSTYAWE